MSEQPADANGPEWDLADRLRKALREADVSVQEMAEYLEVSRNTVSSWINGHHRPRPSDLKQWALRCGVPYTWLVGGGDPSGSHITALMRDQQPGYTEVRNDITAMRKALGHGERRPNARAADRGATS
jgi:transcriptional regulator with XRE-family HTH domain